MTQIKTETEPQTQPTAQKSWRFSAWWFAFLAGTLLSIASVALFFREILSGPDSSASDMLIYLPFLLFGIAIATTSWYARNLGDGRSWFTRLPVVSKWGWWRRGGWWMRVAIGWTMVFVALAAIGLLWYVTEYA